jgi:hypothetical protein
LAPETEIVSPTPQRDGQQFVLSEPPSRTTSHARGSTQLIDPDNRRSDISSGRPGLTPPSLTTESSVRPTVRFDALEGVLSESQILNLCHLVSHHKLQRQKIRASASYLINLGDETFGLREMVTSHIGRVDHGISNTIQHLNDGDNLIRTLSNAFNRPSNVEGPTVNAMMTPG